MAGLQKTLFPLHSHTLICLNPVTTFARRNDLSTNFLPLQTLLIEHGELTVAAAISALASGLGGPAKSRGAILFIVAILSLLLLDNDVPWAQHPEHPEGHHR